MVTFLFVSTAFAIFKDTVPLPHEQTDADSNRGELLPPITMQVGTPDDPAGYLIVPGCDASVEILEIVVQEHNAIKNMKENCLRTPGCAGFTATKLMRWSSCGKSLIPGDPPCNAFIREVGLGYKTEDNWAVVNHTAFSAKNIFHSGPASPTMCATECDATPNCALFAVCGGTCWLRYWEPSPNDWFYVFAPYAKAVEKQWQSLRAEPMMTSWPYVAFLVLAAAALAYVAIAESKRAYRSYFDVRVPELRTNWTCPHCQSVLPEKPDGHFEEKDLEDAAAE